MPTRETARIAAAADKLQAHKHPTEEGAFVVYNPVSETEYAVRPFPHSTPTSPAFYCECPWAKHGGAARGGPCKHVQRVLDKLVGEHLRCTSCSKRVERRTQLTSPKGSHGLIRLCAVCRFEERMRKETLT